MNIRSKIIALILLPLTAASLVAEEYPLRAKYPQDKFITTSELIAAAASAVIVDTRDLTEFDILHIAGAELLMVDKMKEADLLRITDKQGARKLVFYCNGVLCEKSYRAAQMARLWGFQNTYVYDAGIFDWVKFVPEKSLFFGEALTAETAQTALISREKFEAACLAPSAFKAKATDPAYKVFDIRDRSDRAAKQVKFNADIGANIDEFVGFLAKGVVVPKEKILIYDNVGKQVVWVQYYLQKYGIKDYYFLRGGVKALEP